MYVLCLLTPIVLTVHLVLMASASADFTTDLYPVLSQSKIDPCFADIVFPSEVQ